MSTRSDARIVIAEALGTMLLVATVVGSSIMAQGLAAGNDAVALLGNTIATTAVLYVLISLFAPMGGAQFNPAVTLALGSEAPRAPTIAAQVTGAIAGTLLAHLMFGLAPFTASTHVRTGAGQYLSEFVATFGLLLTIRLGAQFRPAALPALVALWITAAYWFTASTSFANPAVTIARALTDSFSGIRPVDAPAFIIMQLLGAMAGNRAALWLIKEDTHASNDLAQPELRHIAQDAGHP